MSLLPRSISSLALTALALTAACTTEIVDDDISSDSVKDFKGLTQEKRDAYLRKASFWSPTDVASMDLLAGPPGKKAFSYNQEVVCKFVEPTKADELDGYSPKFLCGGCTDGCTFGPDEKPLKIKYRSTLTKDTYLGDTPAEIASTRLFWALGFPTDAMYPIRLTCKNCPEDPHTIYKDFTPGKGARATRRFDQAVVEVKFDGEKIESKIDEGWEWGELPKEGFGFGGETSEHLNALKLLAAFVKHADSKGENQRLVCPRDNIRFKDCTKPVALVHDLGVTFGRGTHLGGLQYGRDARASFEKFAATPVWKNKSECQAELRDQSITGSMTHPHVTEAGRSFLVNLMSKLSDAQIRDMFKAARFDEIKEKIWVDETTQREATLDDWVGLFRFKRAELASNVCKQ